MKMSNITHMVLTIHSLKPHTLNLSPRPSTPIHPMASSLLINTLHIRSTHSLFLSTLIHSWHNRSIPTLLISSTLSTPNHLPNTNSTHAPHSHSTHINHTLSIPSSTHTGIRRCSTLTLSTHTGLHNKVPTHNIHIPNIPSILSTLTTPSIHVTHHLTIVEDQPEDPPMLDTVLPQTRMMKRESGRDPRCDNQSWNVVLRDDSVTTGGAQPCHDVTATTQPNIYYLHSVSSQPWNFCCLFFLPWVREGAIGCAGQAGKRADEQLTWGLFFG